MSTLTKRSAVVRCVLALLLSIVLLVPFNVLYPDGRVYFDPDLYHVEEWTDEQVSDYFEQPRTSKESTTMPCITLGNVSILYTPPIRGLVASWRDSQDKSSRSLSADISRVVIEIIDTDH